MNLLLQVGVKILLKNERSEYLLLKRSHAKYGATKGTWDVPGGRIDPGASLLDNLTREVREETQLPIIGEPKLIAAQDIIIPDERHVVRLTYVGDTRGEPVLDTNENVAYQWVTRETLRQFDDLDVYVAELLDRGLVR